MKYFKQGMKRMGKKMEATLSLEGLGFGDKTRAIHHSSLPRDESVDRTQDPKPRTLRPS